MSRRRFFGSLCSMVFLVNVGRIVFAPLLEPLMVDFEMGTGTAGLVVTLVWIGSTLPRIPTGYLLTMVPRHRVVLGTGGVLALSAAFTATAESIPMLALGAFLIGVASGGYFIAANPLVSELFPGRVGRVIGIHGTAAQLAAVSAPAFAGIVLATLGSWRTVFVVLAAAAAIATLVFARLARRTDLPAAGERDRDFLGAIARQWPLILSAVAIVGATGFVWNGLFNFYVSYLIDVKGVPEPRARNLLTIVFLAGVPAFWMTGRLTHRFPYVPLLLSILGAFVVSLLAVTATGGIALVAVSIVMGFVVHCLFPVLDTFLLDSFPDENRASAYSIYSGLAGLVIATGSFVVGTLVDAGFGYDAVFRGFSVGLLVALCLLVGLYRAGRLPEDASPAVADD